MTTVSPETEAAPPDHTREVPTAAPVVVPAPPTRPAVDPVAAPVIDRLATQLLLEPGAIEVVSIESAQWPDACLGLPAEGEICATVLTPGYTVVLRVGLDTYEFRTDVTGEQIRVAGAPQGRSGDPLVTWSDSRSFSMMIIGTQRVATGRRGRPLIAAPLAVPARATELQDFLARYAPFQVQTPAGEIALRGVGASRASETEQRMIAEWARQVSLEARAGGAQPEADVALTWTHHDPAAGVCDTIRITRTGVAVATSCRGDDSTPIATIALRADELSALYTWLDRFEAFETIDESQGPAGTTLVFRGTGVDEAGESDHTAISAWIDTIARRLREAALG